MAVDDAGELRPDEFYRGLSYLGKPTSITLPGQQANDPGLAAGVGAAAGAPTVAPSMTGTPGAGPAPAAGVEGVSPMLADLLFGGGLAQRAAGSAEQIGGALAFPDAGAMPTPSGALTFGAPEALRGMQFPDFPAGAVPDVPGIGIEAAPEAAPGFAGGAGAADPALAGLASSVGEFLPYVGPALGIGLGAMSGKPPGQQAEEAALNVAGAGLAPYTFGLSALAAPVISWLLSRLWKPGPYEPKRIEAAQTARGDLSGLNEAFQGAAASGDPALELAALQRQSGDVSATPGRNPVRSQLDLPADVAGPLGFSPGPTQWSQFSPGQFGEFLGQYGADPSRFGGFVQGSGDVAYLPQAQAEQVAANAANLTNQYLQYLSTPPAPAEGATPPVTPQMAAGMSFPELTTSGEEFPFGSV